MSHSPMPDKAQQQQQQPQQGLGQANGQIPMNNMPHPQPTPAMRQLQIEMQRLKQQYDQLGANSGNPGQIQPLVTRMNQLKAQYGQLGQQQRAQFLAQQQQLQQQQNQHAQQQQQQQQAMSQQQALQMHQQKQAQAAAAVAATAAAAGAGASGIAQGSPAVNNQPLRTNAGAQMPNRPPQTASGAMSSQVEALFGKAPPASASPQVQQAWAEQQGKVQALVNSMNDLRAKVAQEKEELNNPQLSAEQRQATTLAMNEHVALFQRYQGVLQNASRNVLAQQRAKQQQAQNQGTPQQMPVQPPGAQQQQPQQQQQQQLPPQGTNSPMPGGNAIAPSPIAPGGPAQAAAAAAATAAMGQGKASPAPAGQLAATQQQQQQQQQGTNSPGLTRPTSTPLNQSTTAQSATPLVARPLVPQAVPQGRPSLTNGQVGYSAMTGPALAKPPPTIPFDTSTRLLGKRSLAQLLSTIDPSEKLDPDVEDVLLDVADEFIESVVNFSCRLAKHRKSDVLGLEDVKMTLDKEWNIRVMGFADEKIETRRRSAKEGNKDHKAKLAAVSTAKSLQ